MLAVRARRHDQDAVGLDVAGEIVEIGARPEAEGRVVRADFGVSGRDDEDVARKKSRERRATRAEVLGARDERRRTGARFPIAHHEIEQRLRRRVVVRGRLLDAVDYGDARCGGGLGDGVDHVALIRHAPPPSPRPFAGEGLPEWSTRKRAEASCPFRRCAWNPPVRRL
jgi:hypothetical protein